MKTQSLGSTEIQVTRLCYGAMRLGKGWDRNKVTAEQIEEGIKSLEAAVDAGYNFVDHADIYCEGMCEETYGLAVKRHPDWRDKIIVSISSTGPISSPIPTKSPRPSPPSTRRERRAISA
jgi:aryl-alcohol dehydrogenase-like predicted oxidoreductase